MSPNGSAQPEKFSNPIPAGIVKSKAFGGPPGGGFTNPITGASSSVMADAGEYCEQASSVREFSYQENKNRRYRPQMEDTHSIVDKIGGDATYGLFAIFDGHGGR